MGFEPQTALTKRLVKVWCSELGYLASGTSYAPWFHIGSIHNLIEKKYPEIFDLDEHRVPDGRALSLEKTLLFFWLERHLFGGQMTEVNLTPTPDMPTVLSIYLIIITSHLLVYMDLAGSLQTVHVC